MPAKKTEPIETLEEEKDIPEKIEPVEPKIGMEINEGAEKVESELEEKNQKLKFNQLKVELSKSKPIKKLKF